MNGTNKKHMVSYTVDMSENSPVSSTLQTCAMPVPCDSVVSRISGAGVCGKCSEHGRD